MKLIMRNQTGKLAKTTGCLDDNNTLEKATEFSIAQNMRIRMREDHINITVCHRVHCAIDRELQCIYLS